MILIFRLIVTIFALIGFVGTVMLLIVAIQGRIERKRQWKRFSEAGTAVAEGLVDGMRSVGDAAELHTKQLDIMTTNLEEYLNEKYILPKIEQSDECDGCMLQKRSDEDTDDILVCMKCRRSYVEGSECREQYPDRYIVEEARK